MHGIINSTVDEVLGMTWPTLFIALVLVATVRIGYLLNHKDQFIFYKEILTLCFMLYILCLFQLVTKEDLNYLTSNNFIFFKEIMRYKIGSPLFFRNIIGNIILFMPYGFFACYYIDIKNPLKAFFLILFASLSIETMQLAIGRNFDVDDILLNVFGGMIGYLVYYFMSTISDKLPKVFKNRAFLNIFTTLILLLIMFVLFWR